MRSLLTGHWARNFAPAFAAGYCVGHGLRTRLPCPGIGRPPAGFCCRILLWALVRIWCWVWCDFGESLVLDLCAGMLLDWVRARDRDRVLNMGARPGAMALRVLQRHPEQRARPGFCTMGIPARGTFTGLKLVGVLKVLVARWESLWGDTGPMCMLARHCPVPCPSFATVSGTTSDHHSQPPSVAPESFVYSKLHLHHTSARFNVSHLQQYVLISVGVAGERLHRG